MSYQIFPNLLIVFALFGLALLFLRRLPEAVGTENQPDRENSEFQDFAKKNNLPKQGPGWLKAKILLWRGRLWQFLLEAKGLRPMSLKSFRLKKLFVQKAQAEDKTPQPDLPAQPELKEAGKELQSEEGLLEAIKQEPHNLDIYEKLGLLYLQAKNYAESGEVFGYLVKHKPDDPGYLSRLAFCQFKQLKYAEAAENYKASVGLDSSYPSRYYNLGLCLKHLGKFGEAESVLKKALEMDSENEKYKTALESLKDRLVVN